MAIDYIKLAQYSECRAKLLKEASVLASIAKEKAWKEGDVHTWSVLDFAEEHLRREAREADSEALEFRLSPHTEE